MSTGQWLLGLFLDGLMLTIGVVRGWWDLVGVALLFGIFLLFVPPANGDGEPPEDIR